MSRISRSIFLTALTVVVLLGGCASRPSESDLTAEQQVGKRAEARWSHLIAGQWQEAFNLLTDGYREAHTLDSYRSNFAGTSVKWLSAALERVACESESRCIAVLTVEFNLVGGLRGVPEMTAKQTVEEIWLNTGSGWKHLPRR